MEIYLPTEANSLNSADQLYDIPAFGNASLLHFTDCHAQLLPIYYREPSINLGVGSAEGNAPHLVGKPLLDAYGIKAGSRQAYAFSHLDFCAAARAYGKVGGFAHLATLVKRMKASRPKALLLDGGDSWQGIGHGIVDGRAGHGRGLAGFRRRRHDRHWEFSRRRARPAGRAQ
ncbi:MAG: hypothetical protein B7X81_00220 [Hydrogenophilales bacterium 17-61-76]|nr:MAG: hypothetical protein B7Y21_00535 [Hydrogenophilales bacterium 16-61-112]OZA51107.1 MAG: hypothetical protein B7X81_00220 [Hydrogenophilales bacterium 17-61-76]HQT31700.1 hypothetical protein [Thiobacillus sp.]